MIGMDACHQLVAYYEDVPIASNLLVAYGGRLTYLHGASSNAHRNAMAPYLLQWEGLRLAQELDCRTYDFWGIAPPASEDGAEKTTCFHRLCWRVDDPWTGITRFKAGFGGNAKTYPQAVEVPLHSWKYRAYTFVKKLR
jgi:lipid II:glycine glycyltransferase (peptidoglycan interpeptide bridge formation enzyme)